MAEIDLTDEHGYPTDVALGMIRLWPNDDMPNLFAFVKSIWWMPDWGWHEVEEEGVTAYYLSTGGWSGNEDIIGAMRGNHIFWMYFWYSSRVGGHYVFKGRYYTEPDNGKN